MNPLKLFGMGRSEKKNEASITAQASPKSSSRGTTMVDKSGYLSKEGWYRQSWKRRFFKLQDLALIYYTDAKAFESQEAPKGVILLRDCEIRISERDGRLHCLEVFNAKDKQKRTYYIAADSEDERHEWVVALSNNIACQATVRKLADKEITQLKQQVAELSEAVTQYEKQAEDERVAKEMDKLRDAETASDPSPSQDEETKQKEQSASLALIEDLRRELQTTKAALEQSKKENQDLTVQMQQLSVTPTNGSATPTPTQPETEHQIPLEVWANMQGQVLEELQALKAEVSKLKQEKRILKNEVKRLAQLSG